MAVVIGSSASPIGNGLQLPGRRGGSGAYRKHRTCLWEAHLELLFGVWERLQFPLVAVTEPAAQRRRKAVVGKLR
jgi:hypothetical protein